MKWIILFILSFSMLSKETFGQKSLDSLIIKKDTTRVLESFFFNENFKRYIKGEPGLVDSSSFTIIRDGSTGYRNSYHKLNEIINRLNSNDKKKVIEDSKFWIKTDELFKKILTNSENNLVCLIYSDKGVQNILFNKNISSRDCLSFSTYENNYFYYLAINRYIKLQPKDKISFLNKILDYVL